MADLKSHPDNKDRSASANQQQKSEDLQNRQDELAEKAKRNEADLERGSLDDALDDSFPASDPPAMTQPKGEKTGAE